MAKGFVIICVPKSGMFFSKGKFRDGDGAEYPTSTTLTIRLTKSAANKRRRELDQIHGPAFKNVVLPIDYVVKQEGQ